jgi:GH25 family lysozyme M1 (1,4-beta-N-acetylmuramidase)
MSEVLGIDVSHHQGHIDWNKVKNEGKRFAIMKCQYEAQSHRKDETFDYNYAEAGKHGLSRGVYIYIASASIANPQHDAESLLKNLSGRQLEYGIWLDLEDRTLEVKGKAFIRDLAYIYADIFMRAGYYVGIYCNRDWYIRLIHDDLKRDFDFWIARFPRNDTGIYNKDSSLKPSPSIAVAWQYSSKGRVDGITTVVDLDVDYDGNIKLTAKGNIKPSYPVPTSTLKRGARGEDVKWLQKALKDRGYPVGTIDGSYGPKTEQCVKSFQMDVFVDGVAGELTIEKLKEN